MVSHRRLIAILPLFLLLGAPPTGAGPARPMVTVLPLPARDVPPPEQDLVLANLASELRRQYKVQVLSGRALGRAIWGTTGSGLEEATISLTSKVDGAKKAYQQLQIGKALRLIEQAKAGPLPFAGAELSRGQTLVDLHLYAGLAHLAQGEKKEAAAEFRQAVAFDTDASLDKRRFPPDVIKSFEQAKRALLSGNPTNMEIVSKPEGATVIFDGRRRGQTPLQLPVYPGYHFVRVELEGHSPWTLNLPDGIAPKTLRARLIPAWTGDPPEDLVAAAISRDDLSEAVRARLRLLAGFYASDAFLLVSLNRESNSTHLGMRLYVVDPEIVTRARLFNLGSTRAQFQKKIKGIVATLKGLRQARTRPAAVATPTPAPTPTPRPTPVVADPPPEPTPVVALPSPVRIVEPQPTAVPLDEQREDDPRPGYTPWYASWWFWTVTGVLVAGGVAAGVGIYMTQPEGDWTLVVQPR